MNFSQIDQHDGSTSSDDDEWEELSESSVQVSSEEDKDGHSSNSYNQEKADVCDSPEIMLKRREK